MKKTFCKTVLVVEDEVSLQEAIKIKLKKEGFDFLVAGNAEEAILIMEKRKPDIIWLDLLLPGMGGFDFLRQIRESSEWRNIPVIIVSVSADPEKVKQAFDLQAKDYLVKSQYRLTNIVKRVKNVLEE